MKKFIIIFALILIPAMACSQPQTKSQFDWSELYFHYQTGTVAPQYYFSYDITVGTGGNVTLVFYPGYQTDSSWTYQSTASEEAINSINNAIKESGVLTETIGELPEGTRPIGGPIQNVTIVLQQDPNLDQRPQRIIVPGFPEEKYKERLTALYDQIKKLIPESTWQEIDARKGTK